MDKVLIVYGSLNSVPSPEGAAPAKVIVDTVKHLDKEKFQVLSHFNKKLDTTTYDAAVYQHIKPSFTDKLFLFMMKLRFNYAKRKERYITAQDSQLLYFIAVSRFIKRNEYKKVIVHVSVGLVAMIKCFNPKCEVVFYHHGTSLHSKLSELQWQNLLKNTVAIFGVNQAAATMANAYFKNKLPANHYFKIGNGIDCLEIPKNDETISEDFKILFSGRICKEKGVLELIKAFKILRDKQYNVSLIIAGPAGIVRGKGAAEKYLDSCNSYIAHHNLKVNFTGNLSQLQLFQLYQQVNVVVLPTDPELSLEGMPLSLLEAMTMGKPLIATNVGGIPEIIEDGVNGFLIYETKKYATEIAARIETLYLNKDLEKQMSAEASRKYKANFTTVKMSSTFENAIQQINFL